MFYYHKITDSLSYKLNIARAIAAVLVMLVHLRGSLFLPYGELSSSSTGIVNFILFFITRIGHECVLVFFVLSGFLVGGQSVSEFFQGKFLVKKYFINRFSRMWAVIIPALILGCIVDLQSLKLDPTLNFAHKISPEIFIGNVFFTQTVLVPSFGSNVLLWSLANEFWYYLIFPVFLLIGMGKWPKLARLIILALFTAILSYFVPHIMKLFPLWLLGILIRFVPYHQIFRNKYFFVASLTTMLASTIYSNYTSTLFANYLVGIFFAITILCWMYQSADLKTTVVKNVVDKLADFSFSLYAIHYFMMIYMIALLQQWGFGIRFKEATVTNWLIYLSMAIVLSIIAYLFYLIFEKQTYKLRKLLNKLILRN